ncbi:MAG TPA: TonB-dependent receptor [Opitutaceae bacterium]|nr:TonB-dependent receptor [Opitutaceae bacterium]
MSSRPTPAPILSAVRAFAGAIALAVSATAQPPASPTVLPAVNVAATRDDAALQQAKKDLVDVPGGASAVTPADFERGRASNFAEFFRHVPGLFLGSDNAGEATKLSIRGSGIQSDETLGVQILLDGLPYNQGDGEANLEELDLSAVAGAEVYRGADALRYGGYVLGGAIDLLPRTGRTDSGIEARLEAGSFGYRHAAIGGGGAQGNLDAYVSANARRTDGFREHSSERAQNLTANLGYRFNDHAENRVYLGFTDWKRYVPGDLTRDQLSADPRPAWDEALEGDFRLTTRSWRVADKLSFTNADSRTELGVLGHHRDFLIHDLYERTFRLGVTDSFSDNLGLLFSHSGRAELGGFNHDYVFGLSPARELEHSRNFRNNDGVIDRSRLTAAGVSRSVNFPLYAEDTIGVAKNLKLVAGAQAVWIDRAFEDRYWTDAAGNQSHRQKFFGLNPKLGAVYDLGAGVVFANLSRSFQPPSFDDLTPFQSGANGSTIYTPLQAQHAWTLEIGSRGQRGPLEWDVAVYRAWLREELLELNDLTGRDIGTANVPRSIHRGVELGLDWTLWPRDGRDTGGSRLTLHQDYTWNDFRFDADPVYGRNRIAGIPVHLAKFELLWQHASGFYLAPNLESSLTSYFADQANTLKVDAYSVWGIKAGYETKRVRFFVEVRNLQDRRYVALAKPIADARTADADDLAIFSPGEPRAWYLGGAMRW